MTKIILGIDPGIADTGFGIIRIEQNGKLLCLEYGSIKTSPKEDLASRIEKLFIDLNKIIKKHRPDIIAVEELFFNKNVKTALIVGQARGVVLLAAKMSKAKLVEFTPLQVKQAVSTYGRADKAQIQRMVKMILNLEEIPRPDDAADALAVAICASNYK
ncbi:MAG: crossover junction endodeoxyribonuclease RuvC [Patescibacteria group bacterium]|jgi:crossover junction endodeoxyribonuclease RuvC|nr:crossover junction endodeoxyribonuclease RuvC [Patescibacteria group bacterium]